MKEKIQKVIGFLKWIFGYMIMITLFVGGLTFFGYLIALIIGGSNATAICVFIYEKIVPVMIYATTLTVLLGLVTMYLSGETALSTKGKKKDNKKL